MSELTFNLLRFGYLLLLWVFVLSAVAVLRRDISVRGHASTPRPAPETPSGAWVTPGAPTTGPIPEVSGPVGGPAVGPVWTGGPPSIAGAPIVVGQPAAPIVVGQQSAPIVVGPAAVTPAATKPAAPLEPKYLSITSGALAGSMVPLTGQPISIGRAASNTLVFDDDYASGHHARLYPSVEGWVVEDLNSTNGTFIDGAPLTGAALLPIGVRVTIGHSNFKLVV
jgi:hypothetical protein